MSQPNDDAHGKRGDGERAGGSRPHGQRRAHGRAHGAGEREPSLKMRMEREELMLRQRYEYASIVNDILIALWFLAGSVMFFFTVWQTAGTWCFVLGSVELLVRPVIRLARRIHLQRKQGDGRYAHESSQDF
ncbi:YrhK-like protein [Streptomyces sp. WMMB 714]|uniref:YrhK family protein n=1 Tax=Streptomyces sp. WMMB 714 TaxID=1286822 RepID=UPI00082376AF|nr:YrhK family protein [Streptomyces sp. WMMB 714]SCK34417.1 YrhK-like protein [Streptomyces sp. WMMB 714]